MKALKLKLGYNKDEKLRDARAHLTGILVILSRKDAPTSDLSESVPFSAIQIYLGICRP